MPKLDDEDFPVNDTPVTSTPVMPKSLSHPNTFASMPYSSNSTSRYNTQMPSSELGATSTVKNTNVDWINNKWRPMMGWTYMATCIFDFIVGPVVWSVLQIVGTGKVEIQWNPLTLSNGGLYHIAMGAILGISAWSRGQEKIQNRQ